MYTCEKQEVRQISNYCGGRADYVQGGGGNTSVKFDDTLMAIKASGYTLKETTEDKGYVTVNYPEIKKYYNEVDPAAEVDFEKESLEVNLANIVLLEGMENKRPSVEVGFHSFLQRCVIHTHSVYANILCCSAEGKEIAGKIFKGSELHYIFVPYIDPGFRLTLAIKKAVDEYRTENGCIPDVIFMENHGVIVGNDDAKKAIAIHEQVNKAIAAHFNLGEYPKPHIKASDCGFVSATEYLSQFISQKSGEEYFSNLHLYPDQLVYATSKIGSAITFNETGNIEYHATEKEAAVIEETLLGVAYVISNIEAAGLTLRQMDDAAADFINNWESEKYRSNLAK